MNCRGVVSATQWLSVEDAAEGISQMENGAFVFCQMKQALKNQVDAARAKLGRSDTPRLLIVDAQSVNTDRAGSMGYDAGKRVSGIKRHIGVATQGVPHAIALTTAEMKDRKWAPQAIQRCKGDLETVQSVLADGGYMGHRCSRSTRSLGRGRHGADCQAQ